LKRKIGQMTQVALDVYFPEGTVGNAEPHAIDPVKLETAILKYHVGSILNVATSAHSIDHWHENHYADPGRCQENAARHSHHLRNRCLHGATYTKGATLFPQSIALAATRNPEIARQIGEVTAREVRASGIPWNFHPVLGPRTTTASGPGSGKRMARMLSLRPRIGTSYISGLQGDDIGASDKVAACLKHYAGYSFTITGKDRNFRVDRRTNDASILSFRPSRPASEQVP